LFVYLNQCFFLDDIVVKDGHLEAMAGISKMDIGFEGIKLTLKDEKGERVILDGSIRGRARPGRMLAILGPSGAGVRKMIRDDRRLMSQHHCFLDSHVHTCSLYSSEIDCSSCFGRPNQRQSQPEAVREKIHEWCHTCGRLVGPGGIRRTGCQLLSTHDSP
jgi:hypothetical protein